MVVRKAKLCSYLFNFTSDESGIKRSKSGDIDGDAIEATTTKVSAPADINEARDREVKRATLLELVDYLNNYKPVFSDQALQELFEMIKINIFRPLPPR